MTDISKYSTDGIPLVAILRGVKPIEVVSIASALADAGIEIMEVPLNSPDPLESIRCLVQTFGHRLLIGAGTVLSIAEVRSVADAGGRFIVSPNTDPEVIAITRKHQLISIPGVASPTEAFMALRAGADLLKVFPAESVTPPILRSWRNVLGNETALLPVGGISVRNMEMYRSAGATGFGLGSSLYRPGDSAADVSQKAAEIVSVIRGWR